MATTAVAPSHRARAYRANVHVVACVIAMLAAITTAHAATVTIDANAVLGDTPVGSSMTATVLEDINHSTYGGVYSQMLFGERFSEPPLLARPTGAWDLYNNGRTDQNGVQWLSGDAAKDVRFMWSHVDTGVIQSEGGINAMLLNRDVGITSGQIGFDIRFPDVHIGGECGLIFNVNENDPFSGNFLQMWDGGGFRVNGNTSGSNFWSQGGALTVDAWTSVVVTVTQSSIGVALNGDPKLTVAYTVPAGSGSRVGFRSFGRWAQFRNLWIQPTGQGVTNVALTARPTEALTADETGVSRMWKGYRTGSANGTFALSRNLADRFGGYEKIGPTGILSWWGPDVYRYSDAQLWGQVLTHRGGTGNVGVENRGLNRQGLCLRAQRPYTGHVWVRMPSEVSFSVQLQRANGDVLATQSFAATAFSESWTVDTNGGTATWRRYEITLTPSAEVTDGRFAIQLAQAGTLVIGHAFLEPGPWGRFQNLHVRKDIADGYRAIGISALRYGGSQTNGHQFRWRAQVGRADKRPAIRGTYYNMGTNGFGITEHLAMCEALGISSSFAINKEENPADIGAFITYLKGTNTSDPLVAQRIADGHAAPHDVRWVQIGNEEIIDDFYLARFTALANAIWAVDPTMILIASDWGYNGNEITDPFNCGNATHATNTLAKHFDLLRFAKVNQKEIWFDTHIDTSVPWQPEPKGEVSFTKWLGTGAGEWASGQAKDITGAKYRVVIYECNAQNRSMQRALAAFNTPIVYQREAVHYQATGASAGTYGNIPVVGTANGMQAYPWNDNGWNSGMLLFTNRETFLSPTAYALQMHARAKLPRVLSAALSPASDDGSTTVGGLLRAGAAKSTDGQSLMVAMSNSSGSDVTVTFAISNFVTAGSVTRTRMQAGSLSAGNELSSPRAVAPVISTMTWDNTQVLPPYSCTTWRFGTNQVSNHAPVGVNQTVVVSGATAVTLAATDTDNDVLMNWSTTSPSKGTLSGSAPFLVYTANSGATGNDTFTFTVSDGTTMSGVATITLTLGGSGAAPVISSTLTANGTVGQAFTYQITASNVPTTYDASPLPAGLSINTSSGAIAGTPTTISTAMITITASNTHGSDSKTLVITVTSTPIPPVATPPVISSTLSATAQIGLAFTYQITASNSPTSYSASHLPTGLSIDTATGAITGTPTSAGVVNVTISATNADGTDTATLHLTVLNADGSAPAKPETSGDISKDTKKCGIGGLLAGVLLLAWSLLLAIPASAYSPRRIDRSDA